MEEEIEIVTLEDNQDYMVVDEIKNGTVMYVYLANVDDERNTCIRKVIVEDGEEILNGLDSSEELDKALLLFAKKHKEEAIN